MQVIIYLTEGQLDVSELIFNCFHDNDKNNSDILNLEASVSYLYSYPRAVSTSSIKSSTSSMSTENLRSESGRSNLFKMNRKDS